MTHTKLLQVGDRVELTRATVMDHAGKRGTVTRKYVPAHCTGVWSLTVRWDGNTHETSYPYPTGGIVQAVAVDAIRRDEYLRFRRGARRCPMCRAGERHLLCGR